MLGDVFVVACRLLVAAVFLMAGLMKAREGNRFVETVRKYDFIPAPVVRPFARMLPLVELGAGALLFIGPYVAIGAALSIGMLSAFVVASGWAMRKGLSLECDCFGLLYRERIGWSTIARDAVLVGAASVVLTVDSGAQSMAGIVGSPVSMFEVILLLVTLLVMLASIATAVRVSGGFPWPERRHVDINT